MQIQAIKTGRSINFKKIYDHVYDPKTLEVREELKNSSIIGKLDKEGKDIFIVDFQDKTSFEINQYTTGVEFYPSFLLNLEIREKTNNKKLEEFQVEGKHAFLIASKIFAYLSEGDTEVLESIKKY